MPAPDERDSVQPEDSNSEKAADAEPPQPETAKPTANYPWHLNLSDSIGISALIVSIVLWVVEPTLGRRLWGIVLATVGVVWLVSKSHWTYQLPGLPKCIISVVVVAIGCAGFYRLWNQTSETSGAKSPIETPTITWTNPSPIEAGTPLSEKQLNAKASANGVLVNGNAVYEPTFGATLQAGTQTLTVTFYPTDRARYSEVKKTVALSVVKPHSAAKPADHKKVGPVLQFSLSCGPKAARGTKMLNPQKATSWTWEEISDKKTLTMTAPDYTDFAPCRLKLINRGDETAARLEIHLQSSVGLSFFSTHAMALGQQKLPSLIYPKEFGIQGPTGWALPIMLSLQKDTAKFDELEIGLGEQLLADGIEKPFSFFLRDLNPLLASFVVSYRVEGEGMQPLSGGLNFELKRSSTVPW